MKHNPDDGDCICRDCMDRIFAATLRAPVPTPSAEGSTRSDDLLGQLAMYDIAFTQLAFLVEPILDWVNMCAKIPTTPLAAAESANGKYRPRAMNALNTLKMLWEGGHAGELISRLCEFAEDDTVDVA